MYNSSTYQYSGQRTTASRQNTTANIPTAQPVTGTAGNASTNNSGIDTADIATLNDALGSAGVDLRVSFFIMIPFEMYLIKLCQAEEESLQRTYDQHNPTYRSYEDRSRQQALNPNFDTRFLGATMREIANNHHVTEIPQDSINYLALALRARLQDLITQMIAASHHRTDTQFDRPASLYKDGTPMWSILVRSDVAKQLAALEKAEREDEMKIRRERKERAELAAQNAKDMAAGQAMGGGASQDGGFGEDGEGGPKKKRKKDGPGVTARNMSEDVRKKMSNAVASQAAGLGGKYAWMNATAASAPASAKPKASPQPPALVPTVASSTASSAAPPTTTPTVAPPATGWSRPYQSTKKFSSSAPAEDDNRTLVTLRDAMFVIEKEKGHGGGRGSARGWT